MLKVFVKQTQQIYGSLEGRISVQVDVESPFGIIPREFYTTDATLNPSEPDRWSTDQLLRCVKLVAAKELGLDTGEVEVYIAPSPASTSEAEDPIEVTVETPK